MALQQFNIYRISQDDVSGWDTYDEAIVIPQNELEARCLHPDINYIYSTKENAWFNLSKNKIVKEDDRFSTSWTNDINKVKVEFIGIAAPKFTKNEIIVSSYHAG